MMLVHCSIVVFLWALCCVDVIRASTDSDHVEARLSCMEQVLDQVVMEMKEDACPVQRAEEQTNIIRQMQQEVKIMQDKLDAFYGIVRQIVPQGKTWQTSFNDFCTMRVIIVPDACGLVVCHRAPSICHYISFSIIMSYHKY